MPELPEVETVRRGLAKLIIGKVVQQVTVHDSPKSFPNDPQAVKEFLVCAAVCDVRRRAKVLLVDLSSEYTLVVHLKMTGQLVWVAAKAAASASSSAAAFSQDNSTTHSLAPAELALLKQSSEHQEQVAELSGKTRAPSDVHALARPGNVLNSSNTSQSASFRGRGEDDEFISSSNGGVSPSLRFAAGHPNDSLIGELPDRSTRVTIEFTDGSHLYFNDQRKFGWMKLLPSIEVPNIDFMQKVGPEPLEDSFTHNEFIQRIRRRNGTTIKAAILDQTVLAGVGNIYADESLWGAKIHPATRVKDVSDAQLATLLDEIKYVMNLAIEKGGSTDKNYVNAEGKRGSYIDFARVFRREGRPCPRHPEVVIEKTRVAGRGTHICPVCQKEDV